MLAGIDERRCVTMDLITIGWREWIGMPELGIAGLKVKVDTGARTSSLHAYDVEIFRRGSKDLVRFTLHPIQRDTKVTVHCESLLLEQRTVRSSNGARELRPVIQTPIEVAGHCWPIEITLTSRDAMGFRMLLGREAIRRRCLVDSGRSYLVNRHLKPKRKSIKPKHKPRSSSQS